MIEKKYVAFTFGDKQPEVACGTPLLFKIPSSFRL
jgi:hypothetical protein